MSDLFGHAEATVEFKDIRNQRDAVAEEKAKLCLELNRLVKTVPISIRSASINLTHNWMKEQKSAMKVLRSTKSSRAELQSAINTMRSYGGAA